MLTYEEEKEAFLAHYGVPGMKWGKRKNSSPTVNFKKKLRDGRTLEVELQKKQLIKAGAIAGGYVALRAGAAYLAKRPEILQRGVNTIKGTKSIGVGYDVITLAFKNGRWG